LAERAGLSCTTLQAIQSGAPSPATGTCLKVLGLAAELADRDRQAHRHAELDLSLRSAMSS
jgi:hypothetical protein